MSLKISVKKNNNTNSTNIQIEILSRMIIKYFSQVVLPCYSVILSCHCHPVAKSSNITVNNYLVSESSSVIEGKKYDSHGHNMINIIRYKYKTYLKISKIRLPLLK